MHCGSTWVGKWGLRAQGNRMANGELRYFASSLDYVGQSDYKFHVEVRYPGGLEFADRLEALGGYRLDGGLSDITRARG